MQDFLALARSILPAKRPESPLQKPEKKQGTLRALLPFSLPPLWWYRAPHDVKRLHEQVNGWRERAASQQMQSVEDMQIECGGLSGDWPDVYFRLMPAAKFADSYRTKDQTAYRQLTELVKDGIKGLMVYSMTVTDRSSPSAYHGGISSIADLLGTDSLTHDFRITPGSLLEQEVCKLYSSAVAAVYDRKVKDGTGFHASYLLDKIMGAAYKDGGSRVRYNPALQESTRQIFMDLFSNMDEKQRDELKDVLYDRGRERSNCRYTQDFVSTIEDLMSRADARKPPKLKARLPILGQQ